MICKVYFRKMQPSPLRKPSAKIGFRKETITYFVEKSIEK